MTQADGQSNDSYRLKFETNVIEQEDSTLSGPTLNIVSKQNTTDYKPAQVNKQTTAKKRQPTYKANLLITNSNPNKFDQLKRRHNNTQHTTVIDITFNNAHNRLKTQILRQRHHQSVLGFVAQKVHIPTKLMAVTTIQSEKPHRAALDTSRGERDTPNQMVPPGQCTPQQKKSEPT
jgi:hypothetical protein